MFANCYNEWLRILIKISVNLHRTSKPYVFFHVQDKRDAEDNIQLCLESLQLLHTRYLKAVVPLG